MGIATGGPRDPPKPTSTLPACLWRLPGQRSRARDLERKLPYESLGLQVQELLGNQPARTRNTSIAG